jgi:septum site-determining protein MinD
MAKIISFNAFLRGTGKSSFVANVAVLLAARGSRVGVVDLDESAPTMHLLFGLRDSEMTYTLSDFLAGRCPVIETAYEVTPQFGRRTGGRIFLVPLSIELGRIPIALREGLDMDLLSSGLQQLMRTLALDVLLIDGSSGLNELSLTSLAMSDVAGLLLRLDKRVYQGTGVMIDLARKLEVPRLALIVNMVPPRFDLDAVQAKVAETYGCQVIAVLPYSDQISAVASRGLFVLEYPDHPQTAALGHAAGLLVG